MSNKSFVIFNIIKATGLLDNPKIQMGLCLNCDCIRLVKIKKVTYTIFLYNEYKCLHCNRIGSETIVTLKEMSEIGNESIKRIFFEKLISKKKMKAFKKDLHDIEDYIRMSNPSKYKRCNNCNKEYPNCGCLGGGPDKCYTWVNKG